MSIVEFGAGISVANEQFIKHVKDTWIKQHHPEEDFLSAYVNFLRTKSIGEFLADDDIPF